MKMSKIESAIRIVLKFNEAFNRHNIAGMMLLTSEDCIFENAVPAPNGEVFSGKEAISRFLQDSFQESPHARIEIEEVFGLGLRCIMRWKYHWVNEAGQAQHIRGVDIFQVKDGFICEKLSYVKSS